MTSFPGAVWKSPHLRVLLPCSLFVYLVCSAGHNELLWPLSFSDFPQRTLPSPWALEAGHPDSWPQWPASPEDFRVWRIFSHGLSCLFLTTLTSSGHVETESCSTACPHSGKLLWTSLLPWIVPRTSFLSVMGFFFLIQFSQRLLLAPPCPFTSQHFC